MQWIMIKFEFISFNSVTNPDLQPSIAGANVPSKLRAVVLTPPRSLQHGENGEILHTDEQRGLRRALQTEFHHSNAALTFFFFFLETTKSARDNLSIWGE